MNSRIFIAFNMLALLVIFTGCKKDPRICHDAGDPSCVNYDPCYGKKAADASFSVYENVGGIGIETDTAWCDNYIYLSAENKINCTYKWMLKAPGFIATSTDSDFVINATNQNLPVAKMYTVTLTITKLNGTCTQVKAIDSLSKQFYIWPKEITGNYAPPFHYLPIFGTYAGYKRSDPNQLVYVTVFDTVLTPPNLPCVGNSAGIPYQYNIIRNLAYNHFSSENYTLAYNGTIYRKGCSGFILAEETFSSYGLQGCYDSKYMVDYKGTGWQDYHDSKKIYIDYQYIDTVSYQWISDFFTGTKVN